MGLFLLVPLSLLAATTVADLVNRRVPVRTLIFLAPATAMCVAWWASEDLKGAIDDLWHGRAEAATALGLHLALDLVLVLIWFTRRLDRWARHRDDRQRQVLACFLIAILAITVGAGVREVVFRHSETHDLLILRTMILRRNRERPFRTPGRDGTRGVSGPISVRLSSTESSRGSLYGRVASLHPSHRAAASAATRPELDRRAARTSRGPAPGHPGRVGSEALTGGQVEAGARSYSPWENGSSRCLCHRSEQTAPAMSRGRQPMDDLFMGFDRRRQRFYDHHLANNRVGRSSKLPGHDIHRHPALEPDHD